MFLSRRSELPVFSSLATIRSKNGFDYRAKCSIYDFEVMFEDLFSRSGLSLDRLRSFLEMAEAGSIARAAPGDLNRQSQISRQVRDLEEFFGAELTVRRGKTLALSEAGYRLAMLIRAQFRDLHDFQLEQQQAPRTMIFGASASVLQWLVIPAILPLKKALGTATLQFSSEDSQSVANGIRDGRLDFGVVRENVLPASSLQLPIVRITFHLCVHRSLLGNRPSSKLATPSLWRELPFAISVGAGQLSQAIRNAMTEVCGTFRPEFECDSLLQIRNLVRRGACAGILASTGTRGLEKDGVYVTPFEPLKNFGRTLVLHWNERQMRRRGIDDRTIRELAEAMRTPD